MEEQYSVNQHFYKFLSGKNITDIKPSINENLISDPSIKVYLKQVATDIYCDGTNFVINL